MYPVRKTLVLLGIAAMTAVLSTSSATAQAREKMTLMLDWLPSGYHAPIFLALKRGYYAAEGIDLVIQDGKGTNAALQAVTSGNADIVVGNYSTMIQSVAAGMDLVGVAGLIQRLPDAIVSLASAPIKTPKEMEGKTIATAPESAASKLLAAFMNSAGVDVSKVQVLHVTSGQTQNALLGGGAQGMTGWAFTDAKVVESQKPIAPLILMTDFGINVLGNGFVTTKPYAASRAKLLKGFIKATARGYSEGLAKPADAVDALIAERPLVQRGLQVEQLGNLRQFTYTKHSQGKPFGWTALEDWQQTQSLLKQYFAMKGEVDVAKVYTNDYVAAE